MFDNGILFGEVRWEVRFRWSVIELVGEGADCELSRSVGVGLVVFVIQVVRLFVEETVSSL